MQEKLPILKLLKTSALVFVFLITILYFIFLFGMDVFKDPKIYIKTTLETSDIQMALVAISFIIISVLISYIVYLLSTSSSRAEIIASYKTRDLSISREQFIKLYESAPIPYVMINEEGEIENPNKSALRFFGVTPEEILGKNIFSLGGENKKEEAKKFLQYHRSNVPIDRQDFTFVTKENEIKYVLISVFDMKNPVNGNRVGLVSIVDITEQKKLEKTKTEFTSLTSHQLRTPLATIKWYTEMLLSQDVGKLEDKQKEYILKIYDVNTNMIDLVDTLLQISRIEIGALTVKKEDVNISKTCDDILVELSSQIQTKNIKIENEYTDIVNIKTDPKLIRIIIQNLLTNAIKYTPDNGIVTISIDKSLNQTKITVSDTGYGIPKEQQNKVFTKSFRADNVKNISASQSTGLGLYLTKSIVEAINGRISFESEEGKGTKFTIII